MIDRDRRPEDDHGGPFCGCGECEACYRGQIERRTTERDTALADLAAARADLDSATVLYAQAKGELAAARAERDDLEGQLAECCDERDAHEKQIGEMVVQAGLDCEWSNFHEHTDCIGEAFDALHARADTAERDLAALRRRVEEACKEDDKRTARVRATESIMVGDVAHLLSVIDAQRAAADELRGMLREARGLMLGPDHAADVGLWRSACDEFANRPDVLTAIKEPTDATR